MSTTTHSSNQNSLSDNQKKLLAPFIKATKDVFSMMLNWDVELVGVQTNDLGASRHDCSGIIGISGAVRGSVVVSLSEGVAVSAAAAFLGEKPDSINSDVVDTVGELTNMIAGSSKDRIGFNGVTLGLPTVVRGQSHSVSFDNGAHVEMLRFNSEHGPFTVEIAIVGFGAFV